MIPGALARRYARALLGLAKSPIQRDKFAKDLTAVSKLVQQKDAAGTPVIAVLSANRFALADRKKLIGKLASRIAADPVVGKFLDVVLDRGRIDGLTEIAQAFARMSDEAAGRVQAQITSAAPLSSDALNRIKHALSSATGKQVVATTAVDPDLIGGVVAKVGSYVIDGSVRSTLAQLRGSLRS